MPSLPFLTHTLPLYDSHLVGWSRDERRWYGGDAVLEELLQWKGETDTDVQARRDQAGFLTIPKNHTMTLTGHLSGQTPEPEWGNLGKANERRGNGIPSFAELLKFNVDGIGNEGQELIPYFDAVQERAMVTGYRWVLVEQPSRAMLRNIRESNGRSPEGEVITLQDVIQGYRPYPIEYPPQSVPFWQATNGRLDFAIIKITLVPEILVDEGGNPTDDDEGFYLLVRRGFRGLGETYAPGGWWKFDANGEPLVTDGEPETGTWEQTLGQIPLFMFVGEPSTGTFERPAIARSLTMELGQIAVMLMNLRSARDYNLIQAAKSVNWVLGIDTGKHAEVISQQDLGSITIGVPPIMGPDGRGYVPSIWNSSAALLDSQAFESVIKSSLEEAREIMVKQVTSTPDSSGRSKEAGFAEATSPLLARLAATRQQALNTFFYFASLRFGITNPTANVQIPREFDLEPVVDDIDATLSMLKRSWLRSPTWEKALLIRAGEERGTLPDDERATIETELEESATPTEPANPLEDDEPDTPGRQGPPPELAA